MAEAPFGRTVEPLLEPGWRPVLAAAAETPCDPVPTVPDERRGRRSRFAVAVGVGLMGAASLTTAVYQTITQSSTTVSLPSEAAEVDTPLPWGAGRVPTGAGSSTTITPTVADLDLRAEQQPLPAAPPLAGVPAVVGSVGTPVGPPVTVRDAGPGTAPPARDDRPAPSSSTSTGRPSGTTPPSSGSSGSGSSGETTTSPSSEPTGTSTETPTGSSSAPSSEPSSGGGSAEPSSSTPTSGSSSAPADGG